MNEVGDITIRHGWGGLKWYAAHASGVSEDALHIHAGLAILFVAALLLRKPPWHWLPWSMVCVAELLNEAVDVFQHGGREATLVASAHDVWMTLLWPSAILLLCPRSMRRHHDDQVAEPADP